MRDVDHCAGIALTESCAMMPAASVSGLYFAHPQAKYFTVGRDQMEDCAKAQGNRRCGGRTPARLQPCGRAGTRARLLSSKCEGRRAKWTSRLLRTSDLLQTSHFDLRTYRIKGFGASLWST